MKKCIFVVFLITVSFTSTEKWEGFSHSNNLFASSLYKEILKDNEGNLLISPFSAELVLAFVQAGARNETAQELQTALRLPHDQKQIQLAIKNLLPSLTKNKGYSLHIANKIYVTENCPLKDEFVRIATEVFSSEIEKIDFSKTAEAANTMNEWVEEQTENKIHDLISPDVLTRNVKAILINALHFQGNWSLPFNAGLTKAKDFHTENENVLKVETMYLKNGLFNYYESSNLKAKFLEMPFKNVNASMVFVLPNDKKGLSSLEEQIESVLAPQNFVETFIHVSLPKFKIESKFDFTENLKNLGVIKAFNEDQADLRGISEDKLHISKVAQKSFIDVNEGGVEAAAASYDVISPRIYALLHFVADHPFLFYIKVKDVILFVGRVVSPVYEN